jgi:hypothetical protein
MKIRGLKAAWAMAALLGTAPALAAPCAGFTDVDTVTDAAFCPSVEWLRNRGVTTGCGGTLYCPNAPVSRLAMAAFMKRLGAALTAQPLLVQATPGALDLEASPVVCETDDFPVNGYPRRVFLDGTFAGQAAGDVQFTAELVFSVNAGAAWTNVNAVTNPASTTANQWGNASNVGSRDFDVGQTVRFGVRLARLSGTADFTDSRCNLRALVNSRDGAASPF